MKKLEKKMEKIHESFEGKLIEIQEEFKRIREKFGRHKEKLGEI